MTVCRCGVNRMSERAEAVPATADDASPDLAPQGEFTTPATKPLQRLQGHRRDRGAPCTVHARHCIVLSARVGTYSAPPTARRGMAE